MAYVLIAIGGVLAYLDYLGSANLKAAGSLLYAENFSGTNPFYKWAGAMIIIAAIGYVPELEDISMALLVLVMLVIVIDNKSGFTTLIKGL
jgi:hypothetical protein